MTRIPIKWKPSIHMPRSACRIVLEVTGVRVERLNDCIQADGIAEGAPPSHPSIDVVSRQFGYEDFSRSWCTQLWEQINGAGAWAANPRVWVVGPDNMDIGLQQPATLGQHHTFERHAKSGG